jgi:hypothetical protein
LSAADNPFRAGRIEALRFRHDPSVDDLLRRLQEQHGRGALVGPKGSGKTTLVLELAARLGELGWKTPMVRLDTAWLQSGATLSEHFDQAASAAGLFSEGRASAFRADAETGTNAVWFLDGAEQLGFLDWRWALSRTRHADGFVVTTHLPGRLSLLHETRTSPELLGELVRELMGWDGGDSGSEGSPPVLESDECRELWARHRGNLRECFRELYDRWSRLR